MDAQALQARVEALEADNAVLRSQLEEQSVELIRLRSIASHPSSYDGVHAVQKTAETLEFLDSLSGIRSLDEYRIV